MLGHGHRVQLHRVFLRVSCERSRGYSIVSRASRAVRFLRSFVPQQQRAAAFVRSQARQDAPMLPRVLHLKEVALLLYRSIARGEPSWVRGPSGVRIRIVRSLTSLLSVCSSLITPTPFSLLLYRVCRIPQEFPTLPPLSSTFPLVSARLFWQGKNCGPWRRKKKARGVEEERWIYNKRVSRYIYPEFFRQN